MQGEEASLADWFLVPARLVRVIQDLFWSDLLRRLVVAVVWSQLVSGRAIRERAED